MRRRDAIAILAAAGWRDLLRRRTTAEGLASQRVRELLALQSGDPARRRPWADLVEILREEDEPLSARRPGGAAYERAERLMSAARTVAERAETAAADEVTS